MCEPRRLDEHVVSADQLLRFLFGQPLLLLVSYSLLLSLLHLQDELAAQVFGRLHRVLRVVLRVLLLHVLQQKPWLSSTHDGVRSS